MRKTRIGVQAVLLFALLAAACTPARITPAKTQLQIREFQTRSYRERSTATVMKALINALQDEGFLIRNADKELGFITAGKEANVEDSTEVFFKVLFAGAQARYKKNSQVEASANVSEFGDETKVRLVFQVKVIDNFGAPVSATQIEDAQFYQDFFAKVDKSLFLEKSAL